MPLLVKSAETLNTPDVAHEHTHDDGFDVVLPDFKAIKGDLLLWALVGVASGYLAYLIWSEVQRKKWRKENNYDVTKAYDDGYFAGVAFAEAQRAEAKLSEVKPTDESQGL